MGYFDIIKEGFRVGNRNLLVLLTQFVFIAVMAVLLLVLIVGAVFTAAGSLPLSGLKDMDPKALVNLMEASFSIIAVAVFFGVLFLIVLLIAGTYVHAGNLGCLIQTARKESEGFTASTFFATGNRSFIHMLGLYFLWGCIILGVVLVFAGLGAAVFGAVLMPLKHAGRQFIAFGLGVPFLVVLILAGIAVFFLMYAGSVFSYMVLVGERCGAFSAMGRTYRFVRDNLWDIVLFTLLMALLIIAANVVTNVLSLPFNMASHARPAVMLALLPLLLISVALQLYAGLICSACFAVYYVTRTRPPEPVGLVETETPPTEDGDAITQEPMEADVLPHDEDGGQDTPPAPPASPGP